MPLNHIGYASDFLLGARSVLLAGRDLQEAVAANDPNAIEFAVTELERAYALYDQAGVNYRLFMLGRLATTRSLDQRERVSGDNLATIVTDLQVAQVLTAAAQATGELDMPSEVRTVGVAVPPLEAALQDLEQTTARLRGPLAAPFTEAPPATRGFLRPAEVIAVPPVQSQTLDEAVQTFRTISLTTLDGVVDGLRQAILGLIQAIRNLDEQAILEALRLLGLDLQRLPEVGRLIRLALDRITKVIDAIVDWLGPEILQLLKEQLRELLRKLLRDQQVSDLLRQALKVEDTRALIEQTLSAPTLSREKLDEGSTQLRVLDLRFQEQMQMVSEASRLVTTIGGLLLTTGLGVKAVPLTALAYCAVLGWALALGIDYADSGRWLDMVQGVGRIARQVAS